MHAPLHPRNTSMILIATTGDMVTDELYRISTLTDGERTMAPAKVALNCTLFKVTVPVLPTIRIPHDNGTFAVDAPLKVMFWAENVFPVTVKTDVIPFTAITGYAIIVRIAVPCGGSVTNRTSSSKIPCCDTVVRAKYTSRAVVAGAGAKQKAFKAPLVSMHLVLLSMLL